MAREPTIVYPNAIYHIMSRGVNKQKIFLTKKDYIFFLSLLKDSYYLFQAQYLTFCIMPNHYHLILQTPLANLPQVMKFINQEYAQYFLRNNLDKDGHIFKGRYKKKLIECASYAKELFRYIHLNPLKANLVEHPIDWEWSSYKSFIESKPEYSFLKKNFYNDFFYDGKMTTTNSMRQFVEGNNLKNIPEIELWSKTENLIPLATNYLG